MRGMSVLSIIENVDGLAKEISERAEFIDRNAGHFPEFRDAYVHLYKYRELVKNLARKVYEIESKCRHPLGQLDAYQIGQRDAEDEFCLEIRKLLGVT